MRQQFYPLVKKKAFGKGWKFIGKIFDAHMSHKIKHFYEFGEFRLDAETPSLWREGELVHIFPKALEVLVLLVSKHGDIVSREELLKTVWRDAFVEESNITYTVSRLRKTLDENGKAETAAAV
jgi:DNA-binding winged helix-turn-helix (wHTH) protein